MLSKVVMHVFDHPRRYLLLWISLLLLSTFTYKNNFWVEVSIEQLLSPFSPEFLYQEQVSKQFTNNANLIVIVRSPHLFTKESLKKLLSLQTKIRQDVDGIEHIQSILNVPLLRKNQDQLMFSNILDPWPETEIEFESRLKALFSMIKDLESYRLLLNDDQTITLLPISMKSNEAQVIDAAIDDINLIISDYRNSKFSVELSGPDVLENVTRQTLFKEMFLLPALALAVSLIALLILFGRSNGLSAMVIASLVSILPLASIFGIISLFRLPIQIPTALLSPILVVISIIFCVHILTAFYSNLGKLGSRRDIRLALRETIESMERSLFFAFASTSGAMLTFSLSKIVPVSNIGLLGSLGISIAFFSVIIILPIAIQYLPIKSKDSSITGSIKILDHLLIKSAQVSYRYRVPIIISVVILMLCSLFIASQLNFSHDPKSWLPHNWQAYKTSSTLDKDFKNLATLEILIDTGKEKGVYSEEFLEYEQSLLRDISEIPESVLPIGGISSLYDDLLKTQKVLDKYGNDHKEDWDHSQDLKTLLHNVSILKLWEPSLLTYKVDAEGRYSRLIMYLPALDGKEYLPMIKAVTQILEIKKHQKYQTQVGGTAPVLAATYIEIQWSALISYTLSFLVVIILLVMHVKNGLLGLALLLPNSLPIVLVMAAMQLNGIPLDFLNILVITLAMGVVVDDTLHIAGEFQNQLKRHGDAKLAVKNTCFQTGRATVMTTTVLIIGWQVLLVSDFEQLLLFSVLTSSIMLLGLISDLLIAPAILYSFAVRKINKAKSLYKIS